MEIPTALTVVKPPKPGRKPREKKLDTEVMSNISFMVPPALVEQVDAVADMTGFNRSQVIRQGMQLITLVHSQMKQGHSLYFQDKNGYPMPVFVIGLL